MLFQLAALCFVILTPLVCYYLFDDMSWKAQNRLWMEKQLQLIQLQQVLIVQTLKDKGIVIPHAR